MKHVNLKKRKKAVQIVSKRSAVIPTLQKDPPLSHKGVEMLFIIIWKDNFELFKKPQNAKQTLLERWKSCTKRSRNPDSARIRVDQTPKRAFITARRTLRNALNVWKSVSKIALQTAVEHQGQSLMLIDELSNSIEV